MAIPESAALNRNIGCIEILFSYMEEQVYARLNRNIGCIEIRLCLLYFER